MDRAGRRTSGSASAPIARGAEFAYLACPGELIEAAELVIPNDSYVVDIEKSELVWSAPPDAIARLQGGVWVPPGDGDGPLLQSDTEYWLEITTNWAGSSSRTFHADDINGDIYVPFDGYRAEAEFRDRAAGSC